ncbi:maleylpyruvate isomerase family mycothiol-dependent enzyme [Kineosporia babensis]|uniref:Maleylpyruvate isomerase family mycothiol-dependent enzyme n=1 Tax=Kineosporia babensis TaxID=499548 RepID=A0A9X1SXI5_9ACTN|nr:maleylpyruvate isomerase family mycothiol-dependent enzyme [Kineosporia babensis]MCD5315864.1 maleylpyruvate isomerase family mycothiol-dependent enzyme [Kineosporia babensis]
MNQIHELTTANRLLLADLLESLDEQQWHTPTLCAGWSAQEMAAHLLQPSITSFAQVFLVAIRYRGNTDRTVDHITRRIARRPRSDLIRLLRAHAHDRLDPPRVGPMGPYVDTCIHLRDIARPLGLETTVEGHQWRLVLDYLTAPGPAPALFGVHSLQGLALHATDLDHTWGDPHGQRIEGPAEALAMAITGRTHALPDLTGPGLAQLRLKT